MRKANSSKLEKWRADYAASITTLACLYSLIVSWGENWFLTSLLGLGVFVCGSIGFFNLKRIRKNH
ncbi:hypothetical protein D1B33_08160 [Lysinibacillus yapensis]|uniref:Uncharacterized protein n=1 Tax=Ureibacillus yapensis TaxID=2304605 RepID=A0A396S9P2_9BACL|nr:hypothetical protein D1B33_08160 [Lysinibacillus yapensis]